MKSLKKVLENSVPKKEKKDDSQPAFHIPEG